MYGTTNSKVREWWGSILRCRCCRQIGLGTRKNLGYQLNVNRCVGGGRKGERMGGGGDRGKIEGDRGKIEGDRGIKGVEKNGNERNRDREGQG